MDISADGRYLAFSGRLQSDGASLYQLDLQNPEAEPQSVPCLAKCEYRIRDIAFSPDGKYLALTRALREALQHSEHQAELLRGLSETAVNINSIMGTQSLLDYMSERLRLLLGQTSFRVVHL